MGDFTKQQVMISACGDEFNQTYLLTLPPPILNS